MNDTQQKHKPDASAEVAPQPKNPNPAKSWDPMDAPGESRPGEAFDNALWGKSL